MDSQPRGIVPATPEIVADLAARLLGEHRREVLEAAGLSGGTALALSLAASLEAYAFMPAGIPATFAMGVEARSPITGGAMVWMLGTPEMRRRPAALLRAARWGMARAFVVTGAEYLEQYIPGWYETGLRFARRLGFTEASCRREGARGADLRRIVARPFDLK